MKKSISPSSSDKRAINRVLKALDKDGRRKPGKRTKDVVGTGLIELDRSLGGGLVRGKMYEAAGMEQSGKTTLAFEMAKVFQALGEYVVYIDFEHALDAEYAAAVGVNMEEPHLIFEQPSTLEDGLGVGYDFIQSGAVGLVIVDSVAGMLPKKEQEGKRAPAQHARAFGPEVRKWISMLAETNTVGWFINQTRATLNQYNPITTPGGAALKYAASVRLFLTAGKSKIYDDGIHTKIRIWKNKQSKDQRGISEYEIRPMIGIVREEEILAIAKKKNLVSERSGIFKIRDKKIRGRDKALALLQDEKMKAWVLDEEAKE